MARSFKTVTVAAVAAVIVVGSIALVFMSSSTMQWYVSEGDTFSFTVEVEGFVSGSDPLNSSAWNYTAGPYWYLNGSSFTIEVLELPILTSDFNSDSFANRVIEYSKSRLTSPIVFVNGTELPNEEYLFLNELISHSILPIDGWNKLDEFYPDVPANMHYCDTYLSSSNSSTFSIGHRAFNIDAGHGWNAFVNMSTGIPVQATIWASQFYGSTWFSYSIKVTLASG
jgi:hypothetical protein